MMKDKVAPGSRRKFLPPHSVKSIAAAALLQASSGQPVILTLRDVQAGLLPRFGLDTIQSLVVPKRTWARRLAKSEALTADETDRAVRMARVQAEADRVFGSEDKASAWMRRPLQQHSKQTPLDMLRSDAGAAVVLDMLTQIDHGMFA